MDEPAQKKDSEQEQSVQEPLDEFEKLRQDIARQIRSNQRFLENFLDESFVAEKD